MRSPRWEKINNLDALVQQLFDKGHAHFLEMSGGEINATELVAALINCKENLIEGIRYAQEVIDGSMSILHFEPGGYLCGERSAGQNADCGG